MPRLPVIRVDNELLFPGGWCRRMTWRERIAWRFGYRLVSTKRPNSLRF